MPTRNLSIMFTDIKGFTHRTSSSTRDAMTKMMDNHARLLLPVFKYFDGTVVKTIGDAYLVYFSSPTDAVLCGVTIQEVLRQHNKELDENEKLEIRVAINVGDVELMDNDIMGEPVNIAARLEGIAEAGQVYFTEAVYQTMNRKEAPSAEVGEHVFKGIPHPIRVYKVIDEPDSDLVKWLGECVSLSDKGPVINGIREVLVKQKKERPAKQKLIYAAIAVVAMAIAVFLFLPSERDKHLRSAQLLEAQADYINAINIIDSDIRHDPTDTELRNLALRLAKSHINKLVQIGALKPAYDWLETGLIERNYLDELRPQLAVLDARMLVKNDPTANRYTPFYDLADRYPTNTEALYTAAKLLEKGKYHSYVSVWLYRKALERGGYLDDISIFDYSIKVIKNVRNHSSKVAAQEIIEKYFTQQGIEWSKQALLEGSAAEVKHAYLILKNLNDPFINNDYYLALFHITEGKQLEDSFKVFDKVSDPQKRLHILMIHKELVDTYPRFFNYGNIKDAIEENRQKLMFDWK